MEHEQKRFAFNRLKQDHKKPHFDDVKVEGWDATFSYGSRWPRGIAQKRCETDVRCHCDAIVMSLCLCCVEVGSPQLKPGKPGSPFVFNLALIGVGGCSFVFFFVPLHIPKKILSAPAFCLQASFGDVV